ncbi:MAG: integrin alpha, partial [Myxococcota bacterium]
MKMRLIAGAGLIGLMTTSAGFAVEDDCDAYGALLGTADLAGADTELSGVSNKDYFGTSMVSGDFNLDGEADFAIGATGVDINGAQSGAVYVFFGPTTALGAVNPSFADVVLNGGSAYTKAGASLAAFDADGDGADDLLIGASPAGISANKAGVAYLMTDIGSFSGDVDLASQATARFLGDANAHDFGTVVANVGDI